MSERENDSNGAASSAGGPKFPGPDPPVAGAFAARRNTLLVGGPDSGKTVVALQSVVGAAQRGEPAIFVSFDEDPACLRETAARFGWNLTELERLNQLVFCPRVKPRLAQHGAVDTAGLLSGLAQLARVMNARRIAFDGLHVLLALVPVAEQAQALFQLRDWILEHGLAAILTTCLRPDLDSAPDPLARFPVLELIADCVVALDYRPEGGFARRFLRVLNYRSASTAAADLPFTIGPRGIEVVPTGASLSSALPSAFAVDIQHVRNALAPRLHALDQFLELKQAEMDFLIARNEQAFHLPKQLPSS